MYRLSPFTYLVSAVLSTGVAQANVTCSDIEILHLSPPAGETCGSFLDPYIGYAGGYVVNGNATFDCQFCTLSSTDEFLAALSIYYADRFRNVGILLGYTAFNTCAAVFLYWLVRVPKKKSLEEE
jgi:ATP-binding cassette, subfamily G (WHITE), member 2, PDR